MPFLSAHLLAGCCLFSQPTRHRYRFVWGEGGSANFNPLTTDISGLVGYDGGNWILLAHRDIDALSINLPSEESRDRARNTSNKPL
jgi:hypothetical protein